MSRLTRVAAVLALAAGVAVAVPASGAAPRTTVYKAPFAIGPSGGDAWSYHNASSDGTVTVARVYPIPGVINCTKGGPYAKLLIPVRASRQIRQITVTFDSALVDPFTFVLVGLRDGHRIWFGSKTLRGSVTGSGSLILVPDRQDVRFPHVLTIEFGLEQSSACPNVDEGTIHFDTVSVTS